MRFELITGAFIDLVGADQLGEQVGTFFGQWQLTDLVDNQQRCTAAVAQFGTHLPAGAMGGYQRMNKLRQECLQHHTDRIGRQL